MTAADLNALTIGQHLDVNPAEYRMGARAASVTRTAHGFDVALGWQERNGWNGSIEFVLAPYNYGGTYKTAARAAARVAAYMEAA